MRPPKLDPKDLPAYSRAIARARKKKGLSQAQLAERVDAGTGTVAGWESGEHGVGRRHRPAVSKALGLKITDLLA